MASKPTHPELNFTGERVVPGKTPRPLVLEHLARYHLALTLLNLGSSVLDVGCGTGYGTALLASKAARVAGVDIAREAIQYARANYVGPNLSFACADCRRLPFPDSLFDRAVLFEVIEHVSEQATCLSEIRRVLTPQGVLILSTPDPAGPTKGIDGSNPFHIKELQEHELLELLRQHFGHVQLLYQYEVSASSIEAASSSGNSRSAEIVENFAHDSGPKYLLAVCSHERQQLAAKKLLAMGGIDHHVAAVEGLHQQQREIEALQKWHEEKDRAYAENLAAHKKAINEHLAAHKEAINEYARNLAAHQEVIRNQEQRMGTLDMKLREETTLRAHFERDNAARRMELEWLYRWNPINKLFHKLFYGRNLRRRLMAKFHFKR